MRRLHLDFETRSKLNLEIVGLDRYCASAEWLICAWSYDDGPVVSVTCEEPIPPHVLADLVNPDVIKLAWNVSFERSILRECLKIDSPIEQWCDPMAMARYATLPGDLDATSEFLNPGDQTRTKDKKGAELIKTFSVELKDWHEPEHQAAWVEFQAYCRQDVVAEREVFHQLEPIFTLPPQEQLIWQLDQRINQVGMPVSLDHVRQLEAVVLPERTHVLAELNRLTGLENANSRDQLLAWLQQRGYPHSSVAKELVAEVLKDADNIRSDSSTKDAPNPCEIEYRETSVN